MEDISIQSHLKALGGPGSLRRPNAPTGSGEAAEDPSFADALSESLKKVNDLQKEADKAIEDFSTGNTKNIHDTMITVNKADIAFRLTMQVRNKIVEAYQEVMRMQV